MPSKECSSKRYAAAKLQRKCEPELRWMGPFIHFWGMYPQVADPHMPPVGNWENIPLLGVIMNSGHGGQHLQSAYRNGL